jgi:hypothetical protein
MLLAGGCSSPVSAPTPASAPAQQPAGKPLAAAPRASPVKPGLGAAPAARNWDDFKRQAAQRMVAASPGASYLGPVPDVLLAIPVIEIELNADGSVRTTKVIRTPTQATDTVQLAVDAVRRAAPYGDVSRLPRPWKFVEVFLFDDDRRFKPRTLDD